MSPTRNTSLVSYIEKFSSWFPHSSEVPYLVVKNDEVHRTRLSTTHPTDAPALLFVLIHMSCTHISTEYPDFGPGNSSYTLIRRWQNHAPWCIDRRSVDNLSDEGLLTRWLEVHFQGLYGDRQICIQELYHVTRHETLMQVSEGPLFINFDWQHIERQGTTEPKRNLKM